MEKQPNPFDEFLKETLKGHQLAPPEEAKKAFLREASTIITARKGWLKWYYIPVLVILISGTIAFLFFQDKNIPGNSIEITTERVKSNHTADSNINSNSSLVSNPGPESNPAVKSNPAEPKIAANIAPAINASLSPTKSASAEAHPEKPGDINPDKQDEPPLNAPGIVFEPEKIISETSSSRLAMDTLSLPDIPRTTPVYKNQPAGTDTNSASPPASDTGPGKPEQVNAENYFTASAYYLPEWMFNTTEGDKFVNNFGFEATFYRGLVSIRTGAGISISKGTTENAVKYNDYLGTYNKLDSITFIYNESSHDFMPNLYLSEEKVWDSIAKTDSANVIKRYTYLQIPLALGFDFWHKGRFTVGVRVGTIMSVLLDSKQISGPYNPGENLVIGVDRLSPDRVSINWQATGGFDASVRLTESIFIEIEPGAKYYYQSIYEKSGNTKKTWSIGIRAAVIYKF